MCGASGISSPPDDAVHALLKPSNPAALCLLPVPVPLQVMQALVEQCVAGGAAEAVEQCVLRMDILSLDLNQASLSTCQCRCRVPARQLCLPSGVGWRMGCAGRTEPGPGPDALLSVQVGVVVGAGKDLLHHFVSWPMFPTLHTHSSQLIPLCIRHRLFAALIAIFTRALRDHQTPAALLLVAAAAAAAAEEASGAAAPASELAAAEPDALLQQRESLRLAYKLLVFLRCCLLGQAYPPGEGGAWRGAVLVFRHGGVRACLRRKYFRCALVVVHTYQVLPCMPTPQARAPRQRSSCSWLGRRLLPSCCTARACRVRRDKDSLQAVCCPAELCASSRIGMVLSHSQCPLPAPSL